MCRITLTDWRFIGVLLIIAAMPGCKQVRTIHVADYQGWQSLSEGDKAWFPDNLPSTAHNIYAVYVMDTSATDIAFEISAKDLADLKLTLKESAPGQVVWPRMLLTEAWWPRVLNDRSYEEAEHVGLKFFTYQEKRDKRRPLNWGCALDTKTLKVYFWL